MPEDWKEVKWCECPKCCEARRTITVAAPSGSQQSDVVHHRLVREHDVWAVCRLCSDVISTPNAGTFEKMTDGTISAVHRRCTDLFEGTRTTKRERKSFFRRLHESKMAPDDPRRIDYEEVLIVQKPPSGAFASI